MGEKWGEKTASGEDAEAHALASDRDSDWQRHRNERASERRKETGTRPRERRRDPETRVHTATEKVRWQKQTQRETEAEKLTASGRARGE